LILFGEDHLRRAIREFVEHYHEERPHQGLGNRRIGDPGEAPLVGDGEVVADERLGGLLRSYRRSA
jgi:transposase InsO family protein